jgi:hypothetical protein
MKAVKRRASPPRKAKEKKPKTTTVAILVIMTIMKRQKKRKPMQVEKKAWMTLMMAKRETPMTRGVRMNMKNMELFFGTMVENCFFANK